MTLDPGRFIALGRVGGVAVAPDEGWLAVSVARLDADGARLVASLWRVPLDGAAPQRLTDGGDERAPAFGPDGALYWLGDRTEPGDERRRQVFRLEPGAATAVPVTDEPLGVLDYRVAPRGDRIVVLAERLPGVPLARQRAEVADRARRGPSALHYRTTPVRHWDHWLPHAVIHVVGFDGHGGDRRELTPNASGEYRDPERGHEWALSPDGRFVAIGALRPGPDRVPDSALDLLDTERATRVALGRLPATTHASPCFSPDGATVVCARHTRPTGASGQPRLWAYPSAGGVGRPIAPTWDVWPHPYAVLADGTVLATAELAGQVPIFAVRGDEVVRLTAPAAAGSHEGLAVGPGGRMVYGLRHRLAHPPEPFRLAIAPAATPELVASLSGFTATDGDALAAIESLTTASADGTPVQSHYLCPRGATSPRPLLLWIHGGPIGQFADGWHWRWNPLVAVAAGFAVVMPNPRGSVGFGQAFVEGVWHNAWGAACFADVMAAAEAAAARPEIDGGRLAAMGGSFGGYMTNWIGGHSDRFRCLVSHAGLYHLETFHGTTDYPAYLALELGTTPWADRAAFERFSPHRALARWTTPTLISHGEKDYRVPISEALLLYEGLLAHGTEAELLVFPDEGHFILRPQNSRAWYETVLGFLSRHLAP